MIPPIPQAAPACAASPRFAPQASSSNAGQPPLVAPPRFAPARFASAPLAPRHADRPAAHAQLHALGWLGLGLSVVLAGFGLTAIALWEWMRLLGLG
ncbi:hypothetical protein [Rhodobacter lacus]|uniref:hypothetical protein n=1 Tax=Rhodobacter lacus TaxID=1641972 RepID=UPI00366D5918